MAFVLLLLLCMMQDFFNSTLLNLVPLKKLCLTLVDGKVNQTLKRKQNHLEGEVKLPAFSERKKQSKLKFVSMF